MADCKIMAMCLLSDLDGRNLVQDVVTEDGWEGLSFPITEIKDGESVTGAVKKYFKEQLGLTVDDFSISGIVHWYREDTNERFIIFLIKAKRYSGELIPDSWEKRNFFATYQEMADIGIVKGLDTYIKLYNEEDKCEAFSVWSNERAPYLELL